MSLPGGKKIDESTEDYTFGATGKFGPVTVDYEYLKRTFSEDGATPVRYYEDATNPTAYNLLYENGDYAYARTPDSDKDSHKLKARVDLPQNTSVTASYVKSDVESSKSATQGEYELLQGNDLKTEYESFGGKIATKIGDFRLSMHGSRYTIDADGNTIYYPAREGASAAAAWPGDATDEYHSAEEREVNEIGFDIVYRLARGTTLRFGYDYEDVDRDEEELGETETNTFKIALKSRINKEFSGNISYTYQDIDEPMAGAHVGIAQGDGIQDITGDPNLWYYNTSDFNNRLYRPGTGRMSIRTANCHQPACRMKSTKARCRPPGRRRPIWPPPCSPGFVTRRTTRSSTSNTPMFREPRSTMHPTAS